ncbi:MAG: glycosyltransferase family 2 protein [Xanthomonadales bacterium]|nr:glycosyltransferase family 2 protein [Xanthomonadales bacterium]MCB1629140.1 glycosyltransferase family 2 protein [Xanthomonadales bacterium]MCB1636671.1 glycosyltransferase family 2 protein [Xanthomonadales bacterium]MCB1642885.1 glycosyltransferase family 2 protein [Xanthomonadales bacterium]
MSNPRISVVVPAHNEAGCLPSLLDEIVTAFAESGGLEIIVVDDASSDGTNSVLHDAQLRLPMLRVLRHQRQIGQSGALLTGVWAARGQWIGTLDGDGQNDPADLPRLLQAIEERQDPNLKLIQGWRVSRRDTWLKRISSKIANRVRRGLLGDATPDSGCGIRVIERDTLRRLPAFNHMHRFIPALVRQQGWQIDSLPVNHRPRGAGSSHYGLFGRLGAGVVDLLGVAWLGRRTRRAGVQEINPPT